MVSSFPLIKSILTPILSTVELSGPLSLLWRGGGRCFHMNSYARKHISDFQSPNTEQMWSFPRISCSLVLGDQHCFFWIKILTVSIYSKKWQLESVYFSSHVQRKYLGGGKKVRDFVRCSRWVHFISEVRRDLYSQNLSEPNPTVSYDYTETNSAIEKYIRSQ